MPDFDSRWSEGRGVAAVESLIADGLIERAAERCERCPAGGGMCDACQESDWINNSADEAS